MEINEEYDQQRNDGDEEEISQEDAWAVISAYFRQNGLVRQQIDFFDLFIHNILQEVVEEFANLDICPKPEPNPVGQQDFPETIYKIHVGQTYLTKPTMTESDGETTTLLPKTPRSRDLTYSAPLYMDATNRVINKGHDGEEIAET